MAAVTPQTILYEFERLSPAASVVEAATSQSRLDDVAPAYSGLSCLPLRGLRTSNRFAQLRLFWAMPRTSVTAQNGQHVRCKQADSAVD